MSENSFFDDHIKVIPVSIPAPAPRRAKGTLTRHQREVYNDIMRMSYKFDRRTETITYRWVEASYVGSKNACDRLQEKGWIDIEITYGPRGGPQRKYRPRIEEAPRG